MESKRALTIVPQHDQSKRLKRCDGPESSTAPHSAYGEPVSLNLGQKVFLSHSGKDKDFVRRLYDALCNCYHGIKVAFFDEETLPKGKAISMEKSILEEARGSALGVLVLTDNFFTQTRNPMLELEAFVDGNVDLLPLFYEMSVNEFQEEARWDRWERKWEEWAAADAHRLVVDKWRSYLQIVRRHNGLEKCKIAPDGRLDMYIDEVVKQVARIIGPVAPMAGEAVYGKGRLCRLVDDMYKECSSNRSSAFERTSTQNASTSASLEYDLVGIHGFPGLGKSTLCKCLHDFYFKELSGRVCYIDVGSSSESRLSRMHHVLSRLLRDNIKDTHNFQLDNDQVQNLLEKRLSSMKDPVFLAVDNILPVGESEEEAMIYLRCTFPKGSKILVTSKSEAILTNLISLLPQSSAVIKYMPALELQEARDIFEHTFPDLHNRRRSNVLAQEDNLQRDVDTCVNMCAIFDYQKWYHPLMLKSLAVFVTRDRSMPGLNWKGRLAKLASEGLVHKDDAWEKVFQVFDQTYGLLHDKAKEVFMDLALCCGATSTFAWTQIGHKNYYEWIKMLYSHRSDWEMEKILLQLQDFCFISWNGKRSLKVEDLFVVYSEHKVAGAESNRYLVRADWSDDIPKTARHISISRCGKDLRTLDLRPFKALNVLHLLDNAGLKEVLLSRTTCAPLRSLIVSVPAGTVLRFVMNKKWRRPSLKWIDIQGKVEFCFQPSQPSLMLPAARNMDPGSVFFGGFRNLVCFSLISALPGLVHSIDLAACASLKFLYVVDTPGVTFIRAPESSSCLENVRIALLPDLEELAFTVSAHSGTKFCINECTSLQRVSLNCTSQSISCQQLRSTLIKVEDCPLVSKVDGLSQYTGDFGFTENIDSDKHKCERRFWTELVFHSAKDSKFDISQCKAVVKTCYFDKGFAFGSLSGNLVLVNAQHIGPFMTAVAEADPGNLRCLMIRCQQDGDGCGCDQNPPNIGTFSKPYIDRSLKILWYCCPQVRDLASLAQWRSLRILHLRGCTSVEVWPDFAALTSLISLSLARTSLKKWPADLHLHPCLIEVDLKGCQQLPAKELILAGLLQDHLERKARGLDLGRPGIPLQALLSLRDDLIDGTREKCMVADALSAVSQNLEAFFDLWEPDRSRTNEEDLIASEIYESKLVAVLSIVYILWFRYYDEEGGVQGEGKSDNQEGSDDERINIRAKLRGLLSSESFLSLLFRIASGSPLSKPISKPLQDLARLATIWAMVTALVGGASSAYCCYLALPAVIDHHLRDNIIILKNNWDLLSTGENLFSRGIFHKGYVFWPPVRYYKAELNLEEMEQLRKWVGVGLCTMAREAGLEFEESDPESEMESTESS